MEATLGFVFAVIAGLLAGSFSLPMKKTSKWEWENTWLVWAFTALVIIPWVTAFITVPDLMNVYAKCNISSLAMVFLFGVGWGLGAVTFGQSIALIGMSLSFAICIGLTISLGSIVPMASNPKIFLTPGGATVTGGIALMMVGVIVCAIAGSRKEAQIKARSEAGKTGEGQSAGVYIRGLVLAILGGIFSSMINFAFNFSGDIKENALAAGASSGGAADAIWAVTLLGGFATNLVYCSMLLTRNKTWPGYGKLGTGSYWLLAAVMGAAWVGSVIVYGRAAGLMGALGGSAGWAVYMGICIMVSNIWGIVTGEWKDGKGKPLATMYMGLAVLLAAIALIGYGNSLA